MRRLRNLFNRPTTTEPPAPTIEELIMSARPITNDYVVHNLFEVLDTFTNKQQANEYAHAARQYFDTVIVETRKANR